MRFPTYYDRDGEPMTLMEWVTRCTDPSAARVAADSIGDAEVSTVWIGIDLNWLDDGPPLIFETMVFGGQLDGHTVRYSTEADAREGHARMVTCVAQAAEVPAPDEARELAEPQETEAPTE